MATLHTYLRRIVSWNVYCSILNIHTYKQTLIYTYCPREISPLIEEASATKNLSHSYFEKSFAKKLFISLLQVLDMHLPSMQFCSKCK